MRSTLLILLSCLSLALSAQTLETEAQRKRQQLAEELLLNGKEYRHYYTRTKGNQYLTGSATLQGNLLYEGVYYEGLSINYDVYNDLLFVVFGKGVTRKYIILNETKIQAFELIGVSFVNVKDGQYEGLEGGLYEEILLSSGRRLLIRYRKILSKEIDQLSGTMQRFDTKTNYYLVADGAAQEIRNKGDLLEIYDKDSEFKRYLKSNNIKLSKRKGNFKGMLLRALQYQPGS
ncbi:MAG: hypothetical protein AAFQ68_02775 [Bacteroidota bacterium]